MKKLAVIGFSIFFMFNLSYSIESCNSGQKPCCDGHIPENIQWYKNSAEKRAMYNEIFTSSKANVLANKKHLQNGVTCGVVFDIDDTLLDDSAYMYQLTKTCDEYTKSSWNTFVHKKLSTATPGAVAITHYIHNLGCKVNLVTNREFSTLADTKKNLEQENIYYDQVLLKTSHDTDDKNQRFQAIIDGIAPSIIKSPQVIIAYYGDNIQDFPHSKQSMYKNILPSDKAYSAFGETYFILPNPMYGSWQ